MGLSSKELQFKKYYDRLVNETLNARAHLEIWERLRKYSASGYIDELNTAPHFFTFTLKAHFDDALLTLSRILDRNKKSLTIWKFIGFVEENIGMFSSQAFAQRMRHEPDYEKYWKNKLNSHEQIAIKEVNEDKQKLRELSQIIANLTTWRDKVIAHIDHQVLLSGEIIPKEYPLQLRKLHEIVETLFHILNRYSGAFESSSYLAEIPGEDDIQFVMDCVRYRIEAIKKEGEAKLQALKE